MEEAGSVQDEQEQEAEHANLSGFIGFSIIVLCFFCESTYISGFANNCTWVENNVLQ